MIFRINRQNNFTHLSNEVINDSSIEWNDLGLLIYLLSKPEQWKVSVKHLSSVRKSGRDALYSSLKRLQKIGYARYTRHADGSTDWSIYDTPQEPLDDDSNHENRATSGKDGCGEKASSGKASSGKASSGFSARIVSTDLLVSTEKKESTESKNKFIDDDVRLSEFIFKRIKTLNENVNPPDYKKWADTIRLMRQEDHRTHKQIHDVFLWAHQDEFWKVNILSPKSLRDKFDLLETKLKNQSPEQPQITKAFIEQHARPGETYTQARARLSSSHAP